MNGNNLPVSDPTTLTTDALRREIGQTREHFQSKLDALEELQATKFGFIAKHFDDLAAQAAERAENIRREVAIASDGQKEADKKSEASIKELLGAQGKLLEDVKDRVVRIESKGEGGGNAVTWIMSGVSFLIAIAGIILALTR